MNSATQSFLGRYRLVKVLGQGAMGVVYEAMDTRLNRTVAIKTVLRSHLADETTANEYASRFEREAQAAARLSHPHVVTVFDFGEHEDISYIVMEFIRGRELNQAFEAGEKFPLSEAIRMMRELLQALDYAHQQGIVHRDIKPANVMLDPAGRVKLTDFGVARVANANQDRTMPGTLVGTPSYMSPEQILGLAVGSRADIFAAGVILYQFLTGKRPFTGGGPFGVQRKIVQDDPDPPSKVNPVLPEGFDLIISRALAKQPENRYENAAAFAADLERIGNLLPRDVPLIDLDLPNEANSPATPAPAPKSATPAPASPPAPIDPAGLTLITEVPFGKAAAPAVVPVHPDEPPYDPEATVIMFRPSMPDTTTRPSSVPPAPVPAPAARTAASNPPVPAASPPASSLPPASSAPRPAAATTIRAPAAAPRPLTPMPPPARAAAARPAGRPAQRTWLPLAAGAGVAVLVLTTWMLVAKPWAAKPQASPQVPAASPPPPGVPAQTPTQTQTPALPPAQTPAASAAATGPARAEPAAAPVAESPSPARTPSSPAAAAPSQTDAKPRPAPRRPAAEPAAARPTPTRPEPRGIEPRCSDLLQRMQLGEPLTADQTAFFQSRCTR